MINISITENRNSVFNSKDNTNWITKQIWIKTIYFLKIKIFKQSLEYKNELDFTQYDNNKQTGFKQ